MTEFTTGQLTGMIIGIVIAVALVSVIITFIVVKKMFEKQLRENPPISEKMVRVMFQQMGRKASESQIRSVMRSITNAKDSN